ARHDLGGDQLALSQSIARRALDALEPVVAVDASHEMTALSESVHALKLRSVLAVPLVARGVPLGVVYLDDRVRRGAFGEAELTWVRTLAQLAAALVASALAAAQLARAHRRTLRAERRLERSLADRTLALDVAKTELSRLSSSGEASGPFAAIVGTSEALRRTVHTCEKIAHSDVPVLVVGESGSGKELFARAIHAESKRAEAAFVSENCGAIPEPLLESALFGHVRGAFTGADRSRIGLFEAADGGTLFLDEVGEMSLGMQAKLLRVLEDGIVRPLGTERTKHVDVRLIAATHRDLSKMVAERTFREDLFYRLAIVTVRVPPLRERAEDIPLLVRQFLARYSAPGATQVTPRAMQRLVAFSWPGNVRQLENEIRRALVLADGAIDVEQLSPAIAESTKAAATSGLDMKGRLDELSTELVREALARTRGNQTQAAKLLGLSRFGLQKMMKRLGITLREENGHEA
ncbi:MAG TPA: sigma 54-interacting transcriptional regulator, partial [Polyangiaceae bacterium]|nr:sigma 54-interacting transcriptional regulator [Polyangiaceae bacterium]